MKYEESMTELCAFLSCRVDFSTAARVGLWTSGLKSFLWIKSTHLQFSDTDDGNDASSILQKEALSQTLGEWHFWLAF